LRLALCATVTLAGGCTVGAGESWLGTGVNVGGVAAGIAGGVESGINETLGRVCKEIVIRAPFC